MNWIPPPNHLTQDVNCSASGHKLCWPLFNYSKLTNYITAKLNVIPQINSLQLALSNQTQQILDLRSSFFFSHKLTLQVEQTTLYTSYIKSPLFELSSHHVRTLMTLPVLVVHVVDMLAKCWQNVQMSSNFTNIFGHFFDINLSM